MLFILFALFACLCVWADEIHVTSPTENSTYCTNSTLPIDYHVIGNGMAYIGHVNATLVNSTLEIDLSIPEASSKGEHGVKYHTNWTLPAFLPSATYSVRLDGLASYRCSQYKNGRAPYDNCQFIIGQSININVQHC
ncbi:hypothetical protein BDF14DRAFT_89854 [Spinellus fusiger]|nr:hypothetical protein BDF14DRAFT_89854 [Spinellus fusiger]